MVENQRYGQARSACDAPGATGGAIAAPIPAGRNARSGSASPLGFCGIVSRIGAGQIESSLRDHCLIPAPGARTGRSTGSAAAARNPADARVSAASPFVVGTLNEVD